jgi:predicted AAA+ superfamily ATPase
MEFIRHLMDNLLSWKNDKDRKPLLIHGARQVGKTWLMKQFGKEYFEDCAYFNFDENVFLSSVFTNKDPMRIVKDLSFQLGRQIIPGKTLVIFDEIQECRPALNSLKYFCENLPELDIVCAGSLLGVSLSDNSSFPVGKVNHLTLFPLTFEEYLQSVDEPMYKYINEIKNLSPIPELFFKRIESQFRSYQICGGMPVPALILAETNDISRVDTSLNEILSDYILDFTKHTTPAMSARIGHLWRSIPSQLSKENRKFIYQLVRPGARAREYEEALIWLEMAGLIKKVTLNKEPRLPLSAYDDLSIFKIYLSDIGLLRELAGLPASVLINDDSNYVEFKGAVAENYVLQSLTAQFEIPLRYWTSNRSAEVDFVLQYDNDIIPIEVKSGKNVRGRSLQVYDQTYHPRLCLRYSEKNLQQSGNILNIPLFMVDHTKQLLSVAGEND